MAGPDSEHIAEMFAAFGRVSVRRMFSGAGVFSDGLMIALVSRDVVYLKADAQTIPAFEAERMAPFSYQAEGATRSINSYWRMPERLYDDPDELVQWARQARDAALRADVKKPRRKPKTTKAAKSKHRLVKKRR